MPQEELDLLQFTSIYVAQLRTGPTQIVRCEVIELNPLSTSSNDGAETEAPRFGSGRASVRNNTK
jgi:hypothetical protein